MLSGWPLVYRPTNRISAGPSRLANLERAVSATRDMPLSCGRSTSHAVGVAAGLQRIMFFAVFGVVFEVALVFHYCSESSSVTGNVSHLVISLFGV